MGRLARRPAVVGVACLGLTMNVPVALVKDFGFEIDRVDAYYPSADVAAMRWLSGQPRGVVLSEWSSGHLIPWIAGQKVYQGHWFLTLDPNRKRQEIAGFFSPRVSTAAKREFLQRSGALWVFHGTAEARSGAVDPLLPLEKVYDQDGVAIYRVLGAR
jgi:hypothetical protein